MANFIQTLKDFVHRVEADAPTLISEAAPALTVIKGAASFLPAIGPTGVTLEAIINKCVDGVEAIVATEQAGKAKGEAASALVSAEITTAAPILESFGLSSKFVPTADTTAAIAAAVSAAADSRNALANLYTTLKAQGAPAKESSPAEPAKE